MPTRPDHRKLATLKALTSLLETVSIVEGAPFDLLGKVFRGRQRYGDEMPLPCVSILEAVQQDPGAEYGPDGFGHINQWPVLIQGWVDDDKQYPTDAVYALMGEVELKLNEIIALNQLGDGKYPAFRLGGLVTGMTVGPGIVRPPMEGVSDKAFFFLPVAFGFDSDLSHPFVA